MSLKTVDRDYCITLKEIKPWPPDTGDKYLSGLEMQWNDIDGGGRNLWSTGNFKKHEGVGKEIGVNESKIIFDDDKTNSFELHVKLSSGESETSENYLINFNLRKDNLLKLATADIDFAKPEYIVQDSKDNISVQMNVVDCKRTSSPPELYFKIERKYINMYNKSIDDPAEFWFDMASKFKWKKKCEKQQVCSKNLDFKEGGIKIEWFKGGLTNICHNCLDKNIESGKGNKTAFLWEGNKSGDSSSLTYEKLHESVCQVATFLKDKHVKKGDNVIIYLPMIMKLPITMLACARIGAVHSVVVPGYSIKKLSHIIKECKPKIVVTCNEVTRGKDLIKLKENVHVALSEAQNGTCLVLVDENGSAVTKEDAEKYKKDRYFNWKDEVPKCKTKCAVEWVDAEHPLFILYTSRRTDPKPKGVLHTTGGYMIYTATTFKYAFDYKESDVYWCTADCGWITGHSYVVYGPLLNGAKVVLYEGIHNSDARRFWEIVKERQVTLLYIAPKLLKSLKDARDIDNENVTSSCKSLRVLGIVGEPLKVKSSEWRWFSKVVGGLRCPISDIWWQTETGGFMITQKPAVEDGSDPGTFPFFGVKPVILDKNGKKIDFKDRGYLCIENSWPGAFRTLYSKKTAETGKKTAETDKKTGEKTGKTDKKTGKKTGATDKKTGEKPGETDDCTRYETDYFKPFPGYYFSHCKRVEDGYRRLLERDDGVRVHDAFDRSENYEENSEEFASRLGGSGEASTSAGPRGGK